MLHACADRDEIDSQLNNTDPPHPIRIETHSYPRPLYRPLYRLQAAVDKSDNASLFEEVLLYQHQRIVTMTKGYIASNNLPVDIFFDPPHPRGVQGVIYCLTSFATDRAQIWHACADRIFFLTHPTPGGGLGGYLLLQIFRDGPRPNFPRMCG